MGLKELEEWYNKIDELENTITNNELGSDTWLLNNMQREIEKLSDERVVEIFKTAMHESYKIMFNLTDEEYATLNLYKN